MRKRVVSIIVFVCLFCSMFPFSAMAADNPFTDVNQNDYCYEAVMWAYENGITAGTSATTFSPSATCTRSQVVTFLWRANGCPAPKSKNNPFTDVKEGSWYYEPILWAVEEGITYGTSATTFSPNQTCTNGQIITLIWRVIDGEEVPDELKANWGVGNTWYSSAAVWGYATAVLGEETPSYSMESPCPRSNIVTYLWRADQNWGNQSETPEQPAPPTEQNETKIILPDTPFEVTKHLPSGKIYSQFKITDISYKINEVGYTNITFYLSGECLASYRNERRYLDIGFALYDSDGYVASSSSILGSQYNVGDKFRNVELPVHCVIEDGETYRMAISND